MESRRITRRTTADLAVSLGKTAAQITAQFAPVPALGPATEVLCGIIQLCQNVAQNRHAAFQLRDRCHRLMLVVYDNAVSKEKPVVNESITAAIDSVTQCLEQILAKMKEWTQMNKIQGFLHQTEIAKDIDRCHWMISDCLDRFQPISQPEIQDWKPQFKLDTEEDHRELMSYLANIENSQTITKDALGNEIQKIMAMMQQLMGENLGMANQQHNGLPSNLYDLQLKSGELLPEMHLRAGEVVRIGQFPISGTSAMDIYEGLYLGREKVAIKVVRAVNSNENSLRRFKRECDIWKQLWQIDRGQHILPFYGFCQEDGPFPYMVSPWQPNGTALTFVENGQDKIDYVKLVKGVALGLQVLHSINPPVVHGDLRASNIVIDITGNPLIADFGLSRIVEDITGIPFSQSRGVSDAYRWCAPEICIGQGVFTLGSDVYAYGMTVLEIFTHEQPYNNIKNTTEVVIRSAKGEHPPQPTDPKVVRRGLDDQMWALLSLCWITDPSLRPTIQQVLEGLETGEPIKLPSGASSSEADSRELGTSPPTNEASQTTTNDALQSTEIERPCPLGQEIADDTNDDLSAEIERLCPLGQEIANDVVARIIVLLRDPEAYKRFLACRGTDAQRRLDLLQHLLDLDSFAVVKPVLVKALSRLCRTSGLHPQCFALSGLQKVGQQPVAGGGFGDIWKGLVRGHSVCVKVMRVFKVSDVASVMKEFGREAAIWRQLWHPNVLPFFGVYYLENPDDPPGSRLCLVSPWMEAGHVMEFISTKEPTFEERLSLILDVALGLKYLHEQSIVHGDLKGYNILVTPSRRACIADFGLSSIVNAVTVGFTHSTANAQAGTARYQAPELFQDESPTRNHYGSDIYAFGCVCYEILTGKFPFHELKNDMAVMMAVARGRRPARPESSSGITTPDSLWELVENCWETEATIRPTAFQIVERLTGPAIGAKSTSSTADWDDEFSSKFRRSLQAELVLPSVTQIERELFGNG